MMRLLGRKVQGVLRQYKAQQKKEFWSVVSSPSILVTTLSPVVLSSVHISGRFWTDSKSTLYFSLLFIVSELGEWEQSTEGHFRR